MKLKSSEPQFGCISELRSYVASEFEMTEADAEAVLSQYRANQHLVMKEGDRGQIH